MLRMKFVPYEKLKGNHAGVLRELKEGMIIVVDAKLSPREEAELIQETMRTISESFAGIELGSIDFAHIDLNGKGKLRTLLSEKITGKKRGLTLIGPANLVRRIEKKPEELMVYM
jgi:hypothetical protein